MLADFALIASLTPEELQSHISVDGLQHLDALRTWTLLVVFSRTSAI
jgi:hypothetical protein